MCALHLHGQTKTAEASLKAAFKCSETSLEPNVVEVKNGFLIPPSYLYTNRGVKPPKPATGVYDLAGNYVNASGCFRGQTLKDAPHGGRPLADIPQNIIRPLPSYDEAVYGGFFRGHYGHLLLEGFARLWYLLTVDAEMPILIHVDQEGSQGLIALKALFARIAPLDFDFSRLIFCHDPVTVSRLVVPEPALNIRYDVSQIFLEACSQISRKLPSPEKTDQPLYLSRAGLAADSRAIVGEMQIEEAIKRAGGRVIRMETAGFVEGITALRRHRRILGPVGSAFHGTIFASGNRHFYLTNGIDPRKLRTYAMLDRLNAEEAHFLSLIDLFEDRRSKTWQRKFLSDKDHPVLIDPDALLSLFYSVGALDREVALTSDERAAVKYQRDQVIQKAVNNACEQSSFLTRIRLRREAKTMF